MTPSGMNDMEAPSDFEAGPSPTPAEDAPMMDNEVCVDVSALAEPNEGEEMETPEPGDKIQMNIEGEVTRVEGSKAYVRMTAVNGQEIEETAEPTEGMDEAGIRESLGPEGSEV